MTLHYPITVIEQPTEHDYNVIFNGINGFARSQGLHAAAGSYFFAVYDESHIMRAAISGFDNFGCCEIGGLWVDEPLRGQGYGRALVEKAEEWARSHNCKAITVFTLKEWPAFSWYKSLGFTVEFERADHANNMTGCYLIKKQT
ncbi:MAG: GNAT family N-acetyltransferase [Verrucomicrobia bacterium]|nr:GNAT family N-acetyltransferase [Verrucomicrobiota bacterium]MBS0637212.1 GNAT family N-acetyltransferase [Verrucomicrobiota bacterium]